MKTKLFPYISIVMIASFLIAPAVQGFGPFWIPMPELDEPATNEVILRPAVPDQPAVWQDLDHQTIMQGSPDGTIVYEDLYSMCEDPDDAIRMRVRSIHPYNLHFNGADLVIENLDSQYTGTETVELNCNGVQNSFMLTVQANNVVVDQPAYWALLKNKAIQQGSTDGTMIYKGLALLCTDPDDYEIVSLESTHQNYMLYWSGFDLVIRDLDPAYAGTETVSLSCNGVYANFDLSVVAKEYDPDPDDDEIIIPEEEKDRLFVGSIYMPNDMVIAGDLVPITISMKNKGGKLENVQVAAIIQELATRATARLDVSRNEKETLVLEIPEYAEPGLYNIRFTFHNGDVSRVLYRDVYVV